MKSTPCVLSKSTAAIALAKAKHEVTLLEAKPRLGGATMSFNRDGLVIDTGQHVFLRCCTAYRGLLDRGAHGWPLSVVIGDFSAGALDEALTNGPYGRCVYACDNDAVDHQVVALEFPGATTATFTMTAFTQAGHRRTQVFGTRGELTGEEYERVESESWIELQTELRRLERERETLTADPA